MNRSWILLLNLITLSILMIGTLSANAENEPTAWLTIANSTDATLTVTVERRGQRVTVTIPPITEQRIVAPAGYVTFTAIAERSAPVLTHQQGFTLSTGGNYAMNLTPQHFGASYLMDRPSFDSTGSGITTNKSREEQLTRPDPKNKNAWSNLGCYNYFMAYVATSAQHLPNGGRKGTFVGAYDSSRNVWHCEIANTYGDWAAQDANLINACRRNLGNSPSANSCEVWKKWRYE